MKIQGYQPITLIDFPGKVAAISFVSGCSLQCPFCHNPDLVLKSISNSIDKTIEFLDYIKLRRSLLDGVVISGGEPMIHNQVIGLLRQIKSYDLKIKIDTSGINSTLLKKAFDEQLVDLVALDFKNLPAMLSETVGISDAEMLTHYTQQWNRSLNLLRLSSVDYEIRTTVIKNLHSLDTLRKMAAVLLPHERWYLQPFKRSGKIIADYKIDSPTPDLNQYSEVELYQILREVKILHEQTYLR